MKPVLLRGAFFFAVALLQVSLVQILFSEWVIVPPLLLSSVVSWTLFRGFSPSRVWAIWAGIAIDSLAFSRLGVSSIEFLCAAAIFGFATGRVLFGYGSMKLLFFGFATWIFAFLFSLGKTLLVLPNFSERISFFAEFFTRSPGMIFVSLSVSSIGFIGVFFITVAFERYVELFDRVPLGKR